MMTDRTDALDILRERYGEYDPLSKDDPRDHADEEGYTPYDEED